MIYRQVFGEIFPMETAIAGAVFVIVLATVIYAVVLRRARAGRSASGRIELPKLELAYAVLLAGVAAFLVYATASANTRLHRATSDPARSGDPAENVKVTAFQWCWRFDYLDRRTSVGGSCASSRHYPVLVVPTGRPVRFRLTSSDVEHSMWVPALKFKVDAFPHHTNAFTLRFDEPGQWLGRCAEFCGNRHSFMHFYLRAVRPDEYRRWLQQHPGTP
ncbi:hypothetical protein GCM10023191_077540 [Actinoallomurus oryzae]|uniref:Cytochrome aa3 subunit 2 n=1 Tax=Actinoallomurus oryzae TaxID=502180 RepID=A0ABP8QWX0_9ACTN